jgi:hypothetical protein
MQGCPARNLQPLAVIAMLPTTASAKLSTPWKKREEIGKNLMMPSEFPKRISVVCQESGRNYAVGIFWCLTAGVTSS